MTNDTGAHKHTVKTKVMHYSSYLLRLHVSQ